VLTLREGADRELMHGAELGDDGDLSKTLPMYASPPAGIGCLPLIRLGVGDGSKYDPQPAMQTRAAQKASPIWIAVWISMI
jgi:hypothetical protein